MTLAAILTVGVSLSLVGAALLLRQGVTNATGQLRGGVTMLVFLNTSATSTQVSAVGKQLCQNPEVKKCTYFNQDQSFKEYKQMFANQPDLRDAITSPNQLPASYRITLKQASAARAVAATVNGEPGVDKVALDNHAVDTMLKVTRIAQIVILALAVILLLSAVALILNTIRMAIFARRREVAVMKLVGATNWFIRIPFMMEGMIQGLLGAAAACGLVLVMQVLFSYVIHHYNLDLLTFLIVPGNEVVVTEIVVVLIGTLVGAGGSLVAVRRFLEV